MKRRLRIATGFILALAFCGSYWIASMIMDRDPPILYEEARALSSSVPQGGSIGVEFKVFRTRICPLTTRRWLIDSAGDRHSIPSYTVGLQLLAGRETYQRSITVPSSAATGPAVYEVDIDYYCNLFHRMGWPIRVISPPIGFMITPAE